MNSIGRRIFLTFAWTCGLLSLIGNASWAAEARRPFSVTDSIAWTTVLRFESDALANPDTGTALFSPTKLYFLLHVRTADIANDAVNEEILVFDARMVKIHVDHRAPNSSMPSPIRRFSMRASRDEAAFADLRWIDESTIGFISRRRDGIAQAFMFSIQSGQLRQLTRSQSSVSSFAIAGGTVLYYAGSFAPAAPASAVRITQKPLYEALFPSTASEPIFQLYRAVAGRDSAKSISTEGYRLEPQLKTDEIWVSPSGRHAVTSMPSANAPTHWAKYQIPNYQLMGYTAEWVTTDSTSPNLRFRTRYALVDVALGKIEPLLDAPTALASQNQSPAAVFWTRDEQSVILSHTYVPLQHTGDSSQRETRPAVIEVNLRTRAVTPILWEPSVTDAERTVGVRQQWRILSLAFNSKDQSLHVVKRTRQRDLINETYIKTGAQWRLAAGSSAGAERTQEQDELQIKLRQGLNEPPKVFVSTLDCSCSLLLFDPNPQAAHLQFGKAEVLTWQEPKYGLTWKGGALYPTDFKPGRRYPLIVQTHGFAPDAFLLDGPPNIGTGATAMAAQVLANAGFIVLQVEDNAEALTLNEEEADRFAEGFRSGIQKLVDTGSVDEKNIGIVAFSRTGMHVLRLMAKYPDLIAAVNIADASHTGYFNSALMLNAPAAAVAQERARQGSEPDFKNLSQWFSRDALYGLRETKAAVRLEAISPGRVVDYWEMFWMLKAAMRPVDFVYFPTGDHVLQLPSERLASQGGTVDWFRFWLQGVEDADAAKREQYQLWRAMRSQREEQN